MKLVHIREQNGDDIADDNFKGISNFHIHENIANSMDYWHVVSVWN